jgi:hypothetical protein
VACGWQAGSLLLQAGCKWQAKDGMAGCFCHLLMAKSSAAKRTGMCTI